MTRRRIALTEVRASASSVQLHRGSHLVGDRGDAVAASRPSQARRIATGDLPQPSGRGGVKHSGRSGPLNYHGDTHTPADAEGGKAELQVAPDYLMEQSDQDPGAARADRVAQCDGAAVDIEPILR